MKKDNTPDRWALAMKLDAIRGADLDMDEIEAIEQAIQIVCPEYAQARDDAEQESADWFDNTTPEDRAAFVREMERQYPSADGKEISGKTLRFGEEQKK